MRLVICETSPLIADLIYAFSTGMAVTSDLAFHSQPLK
jgi:hypothetical protein